MEIKHLRKVDKGKLKAFFTVDTDKVEFKNFKLMENDKGELWATPPSDLYKDKDGNEKWSYHYRIKDRVLLDKITELAKREYLGDSSDLDKDIPF